MIVEFKVLGLQLRVRAEAGDFIKVILGIMIRIGGFRSTSRWIHDPKLHIPKL